MISTLTHYGKRLVFNKVVGKKNEGNETFKYIPPSFRYLT